MFVPKASLQWFTVRRESPSRLFLTSFFVHQGGKAFITVLYRILWVSVWPSLYVIMRFAGCEQATPYDAPVWLFTVAVRKQAVTNENKCPNGREKKNVKKQNENICLFLKTNTMMLGAMLAAAWGCSVHRIVILTELNWLKILLRWVTLWWSSQLASAGF